MTSAPTLMPAAQLPPREARTPGWAGVTTAPTLNPAAFAAKWRGVTTTEKAAAQEHFIDLCRMLGQPTPHEADPTGESYAFERRVEKAGEGTASPTSGNAASSPGSTRATART